MKKIVSMLLSVVMLCSVTAGLNLTAYATEIGDWTDTIKYSYDENTGKLTLSGQGVLRPCADLNYSTGFGMYDVRSVVIQEGITSISDDVFANYDNLQSVKMPKGLLSIGDSAFSHCPGLTSIIIPESVTSIGDYVFSYCDNLSSIVISDSVTSIGSNAFEGCDSLQSVTLPNSLLSISDYTFSNCDSLRSVTLPKGLLSIGDFAFSDCNLSSIVIPDSVTSIGDNAFENCFNLERVTLPNSLLSIGDYAFSDCSSLSSIVIPNSVTTIGDYAFESCNNLSEITLSDGLVTIGEGAFNWCLLLTKVDIPKTVKKIGDNAFSGDFLSVVITQDNVEIGDDVFGPYTVVFCPSTTKIKNQGIVRYTDKTPIQIKKAVQETDGWYDDEDTNLYYIVPNETGDYYANVKYIFDENLNAVPCEYISVGGVDEGGRCYDGSGYRFRLEAGKRYYLAYKDSIIIKDFCYDGSSDKKYITNDVAGLKCAKATFWDDSTKTYEFYYNTSGVWDDEGPAFISTDLNQPISGYFCGQSIEFSLNSPASVKSYEILNSSALNEKFEKQIRSYETIKNNAAVYRLHLSDGTTYDVKNYTMKPGAGEKIGDVFWCQYLLYTADGRIFSVNYQYNVNKPTSMSVWLDGFSDNPIKVTVAHNTHTYKQMVTKATTAKDGQSYKKCTVCGAVTGKTVIAKASNIKLSQTAYTYNGKVQKPSVTVKDSKGKTLKNGTDYTVSYPKGMKNVGKYTVKVTLKGNYSGTKSLTYNINPKGTSVSKVTAAKKGFKVTWKKQATQTTGYQVQYSTSSKFKKAKTVTISKNKTTSKSVSKLSAKKKYYVRVRTYKTVKIGGKSVKLYSGWSKAKSVTTKK